MNIKPFHTRLYGDKVFILLSLCKNIINMPSYDIIRTDLYDEQARHLMQQDVISTYIEGFGEISISNIGSSFNSMSMFAKAIKGQSYIRGCFDHKRCIDIIKDPFDEVCILTDFDRMPVVDDKNTLYFSFYDTFIKILSGVKKVMQSDFNLMASYEFTRDTSFEISDINLGLTLPLCSHKVNKATIRYDDIIILLDALFRFKQVLEYDDRIWVPHSDLPFSEAEYFNVIGRRRENPFDIAAAETVAAEEKQRFLKWIQLSENAFEVYKDKLENLKQKTVSLFEKTMKKEKV